MIRLMANVKSGLIATLSSAAAIPGAELVLIDGIGHDLAPGLWNRLADRLSGIVAHGERTRARRR
jgi:hypothetical protein